MITVSVCMIVKNESKVLRRCLDTVKNVCDEIVIVDTGSSDDTKAIALEYTDKVYDFEWCDDFSAARNFAFSKCSMEYIYSVDADEVLDEENQDKFNILKRDLLTEIEIVQMRYVNTNEYATTENYSVELRPKLYKRLREFTWIDPIHEAVNLNPVVYDSDIDILHMPISNHAGRDFSVFVKTINSGKELSDKLIKMYARELMKAGEDKDFIAAKDFFIMVSNTTGSDEIRTYSYCILTKVSKILGNTSDFFKYALKNICTKPCAEICNELGDYYYEQGDYEEAIVWYINASSETEAVLDYDASNKIPYKKLADTYKKVASENEFLFDSYMEESNYYLEMLKNCD